MGETPNEDRYDEILLKNFFDDLARERGQTLDELAKTLTSADFDTIIKILENEIDPNDLV